MQTHTNYIGIDISKLTFDVAIRQEQAYKHYKFDNNLDGFLALIKVLPAESVVVMEASGPYYLRLASFLAGKGVEVSVINPLVIRRFCQMRMSRAKTDKKDAMMIAEYGQSEKPGLWQVPQEQVISLQQMESLLTKLEQEQRSLKNQLESFSNSGRLDKKVEKLIKKELIHKQRIIDKLTKEIEELAAQHYASLLEELQSIPGLGKKAAIALAVISNGFTKFDNYRQLSSYVGLSPRIYESGTSVKGKARICKLGMSQMRSILYMCSWSASRYNKACREVYERLLAKGKAKKVALIAVANKLLKQAFAIATKHTLYDENYLTKPCF